MDNTNEIEMFSPEEMQSPFEAIKETDGDLRHYLEGIIEGLTEGITVRVMNHGEVLDS